MDLTALHRGAAGHASSVPHRHGQVLVDVGQPEAAPHPQRPPPTGEDHAGQPGVGRQLGEDARRHGPGADDLAAPIGIGSVENADVGHHHQLGRRLGLEDLASPDVGAGRQRLTGEGVPAGDELEQGVGPALLAGADLLGPAVASAVGPPQGVGVTVDDLLDQVEADRVEGAEDPAHAGVGVHEGRRGAAPALALQQGLPPVRRLGPREPAGLPGERLRRRLPGPFQQPGIAVDHPGSALLGRGHQRRRIIHGDVAGGQPLGRVGHLGQLPGHLGDPASIPARQPPAVLQHRSRPSAAAGPLHLGGDPAHERVDLDPSPPQDRGQVAQLRHRGAHRRHGVEQPHHRPTPINVGHRLCPRISEQVFIHNNHYK